MHAADSAHMTYSEVLAEVCRIAGWLRSAGVKPGDAVMLYMPMVLELPMALLACARIGAVHCVVFGGFSAEALAGRTAKCGARVLLTASGFMRGKKTIHLKRIADKACRLSRAKGAEVCPSRSVPRMLRLSLPQQTQTGVIGTTHSRSACMRMHVRHRSPWQCRCRRFWCSM